MPVLDRKQHKARGFFECVDRFFVSKLTAMFGASTEAKSEIFDPKKNGDDLGMTYWGYPNNCKLGSKPHEYP